MNIIKGLCVDKLLYCVKKEIRYNGEEGHYIDSVSISIFEHKKDAIKFINKDIIVSKNQISKDYNVNKDVLNVVIVEDMDLFTIESQAIDDIYEYSIRKMRVNRNSFSIIAS